MLDEVDHVAAGLTTAAIPELFADVDGEAVGSAAQWTWAAPFGASSTKLDAAACDLAFNRGANMDHNGLIPMQPVRADDQMRNRHLTHARHSPASEPQGFASRPPVVLLAGPEALPRSRHGRSWMSRWRWARRAWKSASVNGCPKKGYCPPCRPRRRRWAQSSGCSLCRAVSQFPELRP